MYYFNEKSRQRRLDKRLFKNIRDGAFVYDVQGFIKQGANIHCESNGSILFGYMYEVEAQTVEYLLENGIDANKMGRLDNLPIVHSLECQRSDIALLLLEYTDDLNHVNAKGDSIIMCAIQCGQYDVVEELLKRDVDLSSKNDLEEDVFSLSKSRKMKQLLERYNKEKPLEIKMSKQGWHIISKDEIAHIYQQESIFREITEIFNFTSERHTKIIRNLQTDAESHSERDIFTMNEDKKVRTAAFLLNDTGANIDLEKIRNRTYKVIDGEVTRKSLVHINR